MDPIEAFKNLPPALQAQVRAELAKQSSSKKKVKSEPIVLDLDCGEHDCHNGKEINCDKCLQPMCFSCLPKNYSEKGLVLCEKCTLQNEKTAAKTIPKTTTTTTSPKSAIEAEYKETLEDIKRIHLEEKEEAEALKVDDESKKKAKLYEATLNRTTKEKAKAKDSYRRNALRFKGFRDEKIKKAKKLIAEAKLTYADKLKELKQKYVNLCKEADDELAAVSCGITLPIVVEKVKVPSKKQLKKEKAILLDVEEVGNVSEDEQDCESDFDPDVHVGLDIECDENQKEVDEAYAKVYEDDIAFEQLRAETIARNSKDKPPKKRRIVFAEEDEL